jgi:hypothetical protein
LKERLKSVGKHRNVLAISRKSWHSLKELVKKSVGKLRNLSAFAEGAGKKAFAGLEMY